MYNLKHIDFFLNRNLTISMTICEQGDIVFLASDGITDNFDPVVGKLENYFL